jgi:hypothetical protein
MKFLRNNHRPRVRLTPANDGPPIRRDAFHDDEPIFDEDDFADDGSPILSRTPVLQMSSGSFFEMMAYLTSRPPELGLALLGPKNHDAVTHVLIDESGHATPVSFTLGHVLLNEQLRAYTAAGLDVKGIAHSHPRGCCWPSLGDLRYVAKCFAADRGQSLVTFLLPIVVGQRLYPYIVYRDDPTAAHIAQVVLF